MRAKLQEIAGRLGTWLPLAAFLGGFLWDAVTLGQQVTPIDLWILFGYWCGAAIVLIVLGRNIGPALHRWLVLALQFFFGGMFSALFIFYFLSSSALPAFLLVLVIGALLVGNEFLDKRYANLTLSWTLFAICGIMLFNFALPHVVRSIHPIWFWLSTLGAGASVVALKRLSIRSDAKLWPTALIVATLLAAHLFNAIPPVPLVKRSMIVGQSLERVNGNYRIGVERSAPWIFWRKASRVLHHQEGDRIYCFTAIFAPSGLDTEIRHRWQRFDESSRRWTDRGTPSFPVHGGRKGGYRGYTYKSRPEPGEWRVVAETDDGRALGIYRFEVRTGAEERRRIELSY